MYTVDFDVNAPNNSRVEYCDGPDNKLIFKFKYENLTIIRSSSFLTDEARNCMKQCGVINLSSNLTADFSMTKGDSEGIFTFYDIAKMLCEEDFTDTIKTIYYAYMRAKLYDYARSKGFYADCQFQTGKYKTMYIYDHANGNKKPVATIVVFDNIKGVIDVGVSICNESDQFVKETGVNVAVYNLVNEIKPHRKSNRKITLKNGKIVSLREYIMHLDYKLVTNRRFELFTSVK